MERSSPTVLVVPGYRGSGPGHWQSWLESRVPGSHRIDGIDWNKPVLAAWAARIRDEIARASGPLWIVAHSFGCLATVTAVADRPWPVAGLFLVAPADPQRFDFLGLRPPQAGQPGRSLANALPRQLPGVRGLLVASRNDPWLDYARGEEMARHWGLTLHDAGAVGHINEESGHGAWPWVLEALDRAMTELEDRWRQPEPRSLPRGTGSALAAVRRCTREQLGG